MTDFENHKLLNDLQELKRQLELVNEKFEQIEEEMKFSGESLEKFYLEHKNRLDIMEKKRINENLFQQLSSLHGQFANIQSGSVWLGMQIAVFQSMLQQAAFFVTSERQALEVRKRREEDLTKQNQLRHKQENLKVEKTQEEQERLDEMAEKARVYPFHLTPTRTWPY